MASSIDREKQATAEARRSACARPDAGRSSALGRRSPTCCLADRRLNVVYPATSPRLSAQRASADRKCVLGRHSSASILRSTALTRLLLRPRAGWSGEAAARTRRRESWPPPQRNPPSSRRRTSSSPRLGVTQTLPGDKLGNKRSPTAPHEAPLPGRTAGRRRSDPHQPAPPGHLRVV
jgi:hypothetical protein